MCNGRSLTCETDIPQQTRLAYILNRILEKVKVLPDAVSFLKPVNKKAVKNYYEIIENPMDLETVEKKTNGMLSSPGSRSM
jgi:transcription initiation factor TFIID subunit 1